MLFRSEFGDDPAKELKVALAVLGILLSAIFASTAEALWRPVADYLIGTVAIQFHGQEWIGV